MVKQGERVPTEGLGLSLGSLHHADELIVGQFAIHKGNPL